MAPLYETASRSCHAVCAYEDLRTRRSACNLIQASTVYRTIRTEPKPSTHQPFNPGECAFSENPLKVRKWGRDLGQADLHGTGRVGKVTQARYGGYQQLNRDRCQAPV